MSQTQEAAIAIPTKQFFVNMLTRDIKLEDAILDLLDNCLDGALRDANSNVVDYSKYWVRINLTADKFSITDNCGGIPREVAKNYAFKMGREPGDSRDIDNETIGMYGVGMKRAIFKMGRHALVKTKYGDDAFDVPITTDWLDSKEWDPLPMNQTSAVEQLAETGTEIQVEKLFPGVARHFTNQGFINDLIISISEHFTMFLQRGLLVEVNDKRVEPVHVEVLVSENEEDPAPFVFQKEIEGVMVSITVGLNTSRGLDSDDEDPMEFERDRSSATAGWTVFCNDRAVIVGDKSRLTGWGDGMPLYHYQYSIITGIVEFRSKSADRLPVTTTKRALDASSDIWLQALVKMKEAIRIWITYTNNWKNHPRSDQSVYWKDAKPLPLRKTVALIARREHVVKKDGSVEYNPMKRKTLPIPDSKKPSSKRIVFSRQIEEVREVSKFFFDVENEKPGIVGEKCFETILKDIRKEVE